MLEVFSWVASILAVTWARKQDMDRIIADPESREKYSERLQQKNRQFNKSLEAFSKFLDRVLGSPLRTFLFCLMLALIYSSTSFLFNLAFAKASLGAEDLPAWQAKLIFVGILVATFITYGTARANHSPSELFLLSYLRERPSRHYAKIKRKYLWVHLLSATYYCLAIALVYRSGVMLAVSVIVAGAASLTCTTRLNHQQQFQHYRINVIAGAALGGHGLLVAVLFFASKQVRWDLYLLICAATLLCAILSAVAFSTSICVNHDVYHKKHWAFLSTLGRPFLYVGFYCSRAPGSFCLAVGSLLLTCHFLSLVPNVPQEIVVPASVILTSAIFLAGATTVAGAGAFALFVMLLVTGFVAIFERDLLFRQWSYLVIFWFIFPLLNALSDFIRWQLVRGVIRYRLETERIGSLFLLVVDLTIAILVIAGFVFSSVYFISWYNELALNLGYSSVVDLRHLLDAIHTDFWSNGVWLLLMISTMLLPTLCNLAIYLSAGSIQAVPMRIRDRLSSELASWDSFSELKKDLVTWRLAMVDSFAGIIFFIGGATVIVYLAVLVAPSFGEMLYVLALSAIRK